MNTRNLRNRWDGLLSRVAKAKNLQQQKAYLALRDIQDMNGDLCKYGDVLDPQNEDGQRFLGNLFEAEQCCLIQLTTHGLQHAAALLDAPAMEGITALANAGGWMHQLYRLQEGQRQAAGAGKTHAWQR